MKSMYKYAFSLFLVLGSFLGHAQTTKSKDSIGTSVATTTTVKKIVLNQKQNVTDCDWVLMYSN